MGQKSSSYLPSNYNSQQRIGASEDSSLSILSNDGTIFSTLQPPDHEYLETVDVSSENFFALVSPVVPENLISEKGYPFVYFSATAVIKLDSKNQRDKKQKRRGWFSCCSKPKSNNMTEIASYDTLSEAYDPVEVFKIQSVEDMVVNPAEAYPLDRVASLSMSPSTVSTKVMKKRRTQVPEKPDKPMSLWGLIKSAVGKDLTKFPLPVNFAEPLSMLQRLVEDFEYSSILDKASTMTDSLDQLTAVAAFTISAYATCAQRTAKPFNPLLGETYEFDRTDDYGWRVVAEQVCHHPPIVSMHCESMRDWVHWQQFTMKSNFRGTYLEIHPLGIAHLRFKNSENHYTWRKVSTIVRNLYMGQVYIEQSGEMDIINHKTGDKCHLKYNSGGMFSRDRSLYGKVCNRNNEAKFEILGNWDSEISSVKLDAKEKPLNDTKKILWRKNPLPADAEKRYGFSLFACQLNEMEDGIPPTDSRNRPDQRFMENALWDEANLEKVRLEDKQREARKARIAEGALNFSTSSQLNTRRVSSSNPTSLGPDDGIEPYYTPRWFSRQRDPLSGQYIYMYNGEYWNCKAAKNWSRCANIFDK